MKAERSFEAVEVGDSLGELVKGPMSPAHIMRWSAATENWHRIHYDFPFATEHDGLPGLLINGSWKQHVLCELLTNWAGASGWVAKLRFRYRAMDVAGDTIVAFGTVTEVTQREDLGFVSCEIGIRNSRGTVSTEGDAVVVLPAADDAEVPHPFDPELLALAGAAGR